MSNLQRRVTALYGIECYLRSIGLKTTKKFVSEITADFLKSKNIPYKKYNPRYKGMFSADVCNAFDVQDNFKEFKKYCENYKLKIDKSEEDWEQYELNL